MLAASSASARPCARPPPCHSARALPRKCSLRPLPPPPPSPSPLPCVGRLGGLPRSAAAMPSAFRGSHRSPRRAVVAGSSYALHRAPSAARRAALP
eukprot:2044534-Prymnesium_polylepis.1